MSSIKSSIPVRQPITVAAKNDVEEVTTTPAAPSPDVPPEKPPLATPATPSTRSVRNSSDEAMQSAFMNVQARQMQTRLVGALPSPAAPGSPSTTATAGSSQPDAAQSAEPAPHVRAANSAEALQQTPRTVPAHGRDVEVYGADERQLGIIRRSLERLPAEHADAITRVVVADQISRDPAYTGGGATVPERDGSGLCRVEITNAALEEDGIRTYDVRGTRPQQGVPSDQQVSHHLLHEAAHAATRDTRQNLSMGATADNLGDVVYRGYIRRGSDPRGPTNERFATAYGQYLLDPEAFRRLDPEAAATVESCIERAHARFVRRTRN